MSERLLSCLELVAKDLCEAHAAERMLSNMATRHNRLAEFNDSEGRFGLRFIEDALALRMALAVNRTLQGTSANRSSFARLLKLITSTGVDVDVSGFEERIQGLRQEQAARRLHQCRNGFMAHTLVGEAGSRGGMRVQPIADLLYRLTDLYEEIHRATAGTEDPVISRTLETWRRRAQNTWDSLVGPEDDDSGRVIATRAPEEAAQTAGSCTGDYLARRLADGKRRA